MTDKQDIHDGLMVQIARYARRFYVDDFNTLRLIRAGIEASIRTLTDRIDELEAQQHQIAEPASPWRPIETAPKDGRTLLLGYFSSHKKWRTMRGQWMSEDYIAENWEEPDGGGPGWYETVVEHDDIPNCWFTEPKYWMPLPPAPKEPS